MTPYPRFLADDLPERPPEKCAVHLLPLPIEETVSYGTGTADGPHAILEASSQLEVFLEEQLPGECGIYVRPPILFDKSMENTLERIASETRHVYAQGKKLLGLGGEHSVTWGMVKGLQQAGASFGVVQFDAHADLRDRYEDTPYSHACVMRRVHEAGIPLYQVGVRSLCEEENLYRKQHDIAYCDARTLFSEGHEAAFLPDDFPQNLFITFDVDALDSSLMPATGTPEPGGLNWWQSISLIETLCHNRKLIGADVVELAPIPTLHHANFTAAKLAYTLIRQLTC